MTCSDMPKKRERRRIVVEVDDDDVTAIDAVGQASTFRASRSAIVRELLRRGLESFLEHEPPRVRA